MTATGPPNDVIAELLRIHAQDREAHFVTDVERLLEHQGETFISVANGQIFQGTWAEAAAMFRDYFANATYYAWDDLEPPIVRVSADATLAWMITRTRVHRSQPRPDGSVAEHQFVYAGIMCYAKEAGRWVRVANVSTFEQPRA